MWKFEKVFSDDGSELSTATLDTTLGIPIECVYDGRFLWVTCTAGLGIYEFWGASSDNEPSVDEIDELLYPRYTEEGPKRKLKLITFYSFTSEIKRSTRYVQLSLAPTWTSGAGSTTVGSTALTFTQKRADLLICTEVSTNTNGALSPYWITKVDNKIVVSALNFSKVFIFDIGAQRFESTMTLASEPSGVPTVANSNLHGQNGRIWCVNTLFSDTLAQRLISKTLAGTETSTAINVRPSESRTWIANGFNGSVYITNHNGVSISRYDQDTAALGARIRTSSWPHHIWSTQDRRIIVASGDALLTTVDYDDDGVHHDNNSETVPSSLTQDPINGNRLWFARANDIARLTLGTGEMIEIGTSDEDWVIKDSGLDDPLFVLGLPIQTFYLEDGTPRSTRPYLVTLSGSAVHLVQLDTPLVRPYYVELNGQGAVVGGALQYFGEQ